MYTFTGRVRYSETDEDKKISLPAIMDYLQDCSLFHAEAQGVGPDHMDRVHRAWLLCSWQILIDRYPRMFEDITIGTAPYDFSNGIGRRNFLITDREGAWLVHANSNWLFLDTANGKLIKPEQAEIDAYPLSPKIDMDYAPRHLRLPKEMDPAAPFVVRQSQIDTNHHMNNAQYVTAAQQALSEKGYSDRMPLSEIRVEYKKMARLGDTVVPYVKEQDGWLYVKLADEEGAVYASVALLPQKGCPAAESL